MYLSYFYIRIEGHSLICLIGLNLSVFPIKGQLYSACIQINFTAIFDDFNKKP